MIWFGESFGYTGQIQNTDVAWTVGRSNTSGNSVRKNR